MQKVPNEYMWLQVYFLNESILSCDRTAHPLAFHFSEKILVWTFGQCSLGRIDQIMVPKANYRNQKNLTCHCLKSLLKELRLFMPLISSLRGRIQSRENWKQAPDQKRGDQVQEP